MYKHLKTIIENGSYQLDALKSRLENLAANGDITPGEKDQLLIDARVKADPAQEIDARRMILDHETRIKALEAKIDELMGQSGEGSEGGETGVITLHPEYVVGTPTYNGDKWSFNGVNYTVANVPDGQVCVWSPEGYPAYWVRDAVQPESGDAV